MPIPELAERVSRLEADNHTREKQVDEIFGLIRSANDANNRTALLQEKTQTQLDQMSATVSQSGEQITDLRLKAASAQGGGKVILWLIGGGGAAAGALLSWLALHPK